MPNYLISVLYAPGLIPVTEDEFDWKTTNEVKWYYGNIASGTKVSLLSRMGGPISLIQMQLKRFNCRLASYTINSEGSLRLHCDACNKFQVLVPQASPYLALQGCSMCISKLNLIDVSLLVSEFITFYKFTNS